uniref:Hedgehog protein Hint domain-containing protein n=1 Tax=Rhodosorus marinus TaxID=101924 RepID=A0A7S0G8J1_9RHOD|mmetsp:Transcript_8467/g.12480  ORF Transcript_8467/g.12480 Transcript_8467/m.12480 type:complete len:113 (+) Transcript_8467:466-804(+)
MSDGQVKTVDEVQVGDMIESVDARGRRSFSEVFLIQHGKQTAVRRLRQIHFNTLDAKASGAITLSNTHLLRVAKDKDEFVPAKSIKLGSKVFVVPETESEATAAVVTKILNL